jgi:hypothetical protein
MEKIIKDILASMERDLPAKPKHVSVTTEILDYNGEKIVGIHCMININDELWSLTDDYIPENGEPTLELCGAIANALATKIQEKYLCTTFACIEVSGARMSI